MSERQWIPVEATAVLHQSCLRLVCVVSIFHYCTLYYVVDLGQIVHLNEATGKVKNRLMFDTCHHFASAMSDACAPPEGCAPRALHALEKITSAEIPATHALKGSSYELTGDPQRPDAMEASYAKMTCSRANLRAAR